jgi:hypothetical protein
VLSNGGVGKRFRVYCCSTFTLCDGDVDLSGDNMNTIKKNTEALRFSVIVPVVLYGYKSWFLVIMEEYILMAFETRVLKRIFVLKSDEIIGGWRKLQKRTFITFTSHQLLLE